MELCSAGLTGSLPRALPGGPLKHTLVLLSLLAATPLLARADQLVSAGSLISCTVSEPNISSKTEKVGDAILCQLGHTEVYGRNSFPYGSYLVGHFAEYKDPGHFVGKGWMELDFDRMVVQPDTVVPINARVVAAPKYKVDQDGHILGKGHATKDTVEWLVPVLWPLDLINLPRRGPRPVLPAESKLTLKIQDDFGIPTPQENAIRTPALVSRQTPDEPTYQQYRQPAPVQQAYQPPPQQYQPAPVQQAYAQPMYAPAQPQVIVVQAQPQTVVVQQQQQQQAPPQRPVYRYPVPYGYYPPPGYGYYPY